MSFYKKAQNKLWINFHSSDDLNKIRLDICPILLADISTRDTGTNDGCWRRPSVHKMPFKNCLRFDRDASMSWQFQPVYPGLYSQPESSWGWEKIKRRGCTPMGCISPLTRIQKDRKRKHFWWDLGIMWEQQWIYFLLIYQLLPGNVFAPSDEVVWFTGAWLNLRSLLFQKRRKAWNFVCQYRNSESAVQTQVPRWAANLKKQDFKKLISCARRDDWSIISLQPHTFPRASLPSQLWHWLTVVSSNVSCRSFCALVILRNHKGKYRERCDWAHQDKC